jgi:hypothetical protein
MTIPTWTFNTKTQGNSEFGFYPQITQISPITEAESETESV